MALRSNSATQCSFISDATKHKQDLQLVSLRRAESGTSRASLCSLQNCEVDADDENFVNLHQMTNCMKKINYALWIMNELNNASWRQKCWRTRVTDTGCQQQVWYCASCSCSKTLRSNTSDRGCRWRSLRFNWASFSSRNYYICYVYIYTLTTSTIPTTSTNLVLKLLLLILLPLLL